MNFHAVDPRFQKPMGAPKLGNNYYGPPPDDQERLDQYPEHQIAKGAYRDTGCSVMVSPCLECPLPRCLEDLPEGFLRDDRNAQIRSMHKQGKPIAEIASKFGVATRTVHRVCKPT